MATRVAAVAAPIVVALALYPSASRAWHGAVDGDLERAYVYLRSLPSDTLVAAHPTVADAIPLRTRHSVLASTETWISFQLGYRSQLVPRLDASLHAAYASTWQDFDSVLQPYGVDVFVVAPYQWGERSYSAPFEGLVTKLMQVGEQQGFVLRDPPPERILFRSGAVTVVKVEQAATR